MTPHASSTQRNDLAWLAFLVVVGGGLSAYLATSAFDATVSLSGILCVGLIALGRREGYLVGLYNSIAYSVLAFRNELFGEVYLNLLFFVPTGVLGYVLWSRHTGLGKTVVMRQLGWGQRAWVAGVCVAGALGLGWLLGLNPRQNTPFVDASTNVLSVVATLLMMGRFKEQWLLYILLNVLSIVMWSLRYRAGGAAGDLMVLMWSLYLVNAVFGAWRWHLGAKQPVPVGLIGPAERGACDAG
jgi:nicotinamide mononucleotide transporter